jgi:antitoxin HicB
MTLHKYYAVVEPTDEGNYLVTFPDIENCFTQGDNLAHAVEMAKDALGLILTHYEDEGNVPTPSPVDKHKATLPEVASLILIEVGTDEDREAV